jgi:hypothetical protein
MIQDTIPKHVLWRCYVKMLRDACMCVCVCVCVVADE